MWVASTTGFFSIVRAKRRDMVQVRARSKADINRLRERFDITQRIVKTPQADYPYRIVMPRGRWCVIAARLAADVSDYANFKGAVYETNRQRAETYYVLWHDLKRIGDEVDA